jgi:D-alanyl-D-alanine endopeptidase (penicillin-binding protein 7)
VLEVVVLSGIKFPRRLLALLGLALAAAFMQPVPAAAQSHVKYKTALTKKPVQKPVAGKRPQANKKVTKNANKKTTKRVVKRSNTRRTVVRAAPPRPSYGQVFGLHSTLDPLALKSSVALVIDQDTDEVLFSKNPQAVLPIASITKLMTALVVIEAAQPLDEILTVTQADVDTEKGSGSRLRIGTQLSRGEMLHLALMSSENRAANALGRHYPGGLPAFVQSMNLRARELGMADTRYVEPTGLSSLNQSSAHDLALLVRAAHEYNLIRALSTSPEYAVAVGSRHLQFRNSNGLVRSGTWDIGLQKTGYISEAGRCLVMQAEFAGRKLIMVLLDSAGRYSRIGDAERIRDWMLQAQTNAMASLPAAE